MPRSTDSSRYSHEDYTISIVKLIYRDLIENHPKAETLGIKAEEITALLGDQSVRLTRTSLIWKELISSQLDADRADYLLRDSLHIGVNYGLYDRTRLINCVTIGKSAEASCFLAIGEGGWHIAESIVLARYQMFSQVYFHPVRRAFDYHIGQAIREVLLNRGYSDGLFPEPTTESNLNEYLAFDDSVVYSAFKQGDGGEHGEIILNRTPYKCKKEWDRELSDADEREARSAIEQYGGFLDKAAVTKWYKLDKDVNVYNEKAGRTIQLSVKSKLIEIMPSLPKTTRLYINQSGEGVDYEYKL
jgi:HD superfamily phosphohydrolase